MSDDPTDARREERCRTIEMMMVNLALGMTPAEAAYLTWDHGQYLTPNNFNIAEFPLPDGWEDTFEFFDSKYRDIMQKNA